MTTPTIVDKYQVAPSPGGPAELLLPLLYPDILFFPPSILDHLLFYSFRCSESHFSDTIVPNLKNSLSLTLKHFAPLAGKIVFPRTAGMPFCRYADGDSITMTVAISSADFSHLTRNLPVRDADQYHDFAAQMPPVTYLPDFINFSTAAIQVTLFPDQGFCICITNQHAVADGSSILSFMHAWASVTKFNGAPNLYYYKSPPSYDRSTVQDADVLTTACWELVKTRRRNMVFSNHSLPVTGKVRATFVLSGAQIQKLKNFALSTKLPNMMSSNHISAYTVVCAHVWTSLARTAAAMGEEVGDDEPEYFKSAANFRGRLKPPLPESYFGNCLGRVLAESTHGRLKGDRGIAFAAEAINDAIRKIVDNEKGVLDGYMNRLIKAERLAATSGNNRVVAVAGSSKFNPYDSDFGWGRPEMYHLVDIDQSGVFSLCKSREYNGIEIGFSMTKVKMDAFIAIFNLGLRQATQTAYIDDHHLSKL